MILTIPQERNENIRSMAVNNNEKAVIKGYIIPKAMFQIMRLALLFG